MTLEINRRLRIQKGDCARCGSPVHIEPEERYGYTDFDNGSEGPRTFIIERCDGGDCPPREFMSLVALTQVEALLIRFDRGDLTVEELERELYR